MIAFLEKYSIAIVSLFVLIAVVLRIFIISGNNFVFYFDQSRDAYLSQQIFQQHKLKIQGPSASGTNDTIYHGVLYYYLIGPVYTLSHGNPYPVLIFLIILTSFTIIPIYWLAKSVFHSTLVALLAIAFFALSFDVSEFSTFLANPIYSLPASALFFYAIWQLFFKNKHNWLPVMMLALGVSNQAGIYTLYLWACVVFAHLVSRQYHFTENVFKHKKLVIVSLLLYFFSVSSMILTELLLMYHGILHLNDLLSISGNSQDVWGSIQAILGSYLMTMSTAFLPSSVLVSFVILLLLFLRYKHSLPKKELLFFSLCFFSPIFLFLFQPREGEHYLIIIISLIYVLLAYICSLLLKTKNGRYIFAILCVMFLVSNFLATQRAIKAKYSPFSVQQGAVLQDQLKAIDYTYTMAKSKPFSISTLTNPYGYNITWAYLYHWYGKQKYGYTPVFYGSPQAGLFGSDLLVEQNHPSDIHFTISEPYQGLDRDTIASFERDQTRLVSSPSATQLFEGIMVENRSPGI